MILHVGSFSFGFRMPLDSLLCFTIEFVMMYFIDKVEDAYLEANTYIKLELYQNERRGFALKPQRFTADSFKAQQGEIEFVPYVSTYVTYLRICTYAHLLSSL